LIGLIFLIEYLLKKIIECYLNNFIDNKMGW